MKKKIKQWFNQLITTFLVKVKPIPRITPYHQQVDWINSNEKIVPLMAEHRSGKTIAAVEKILDFVIVNPGVTVILACDSSVLLEHTILSDLREKLDDFNHPIVLSKYKSITRTLTFRNGSMIRIASNPRAIQALKADLAYCCECSFTEDVIARTSGQILIEFN